MKRTTIPTTSRLARLGTLATCAVAPIGMGSAIVAADAPVNIPPAAITDAQIEEAKLGLRTYLADSVISDLTDSSIAEPAECPVVRLDQVGYWMGQLEMVGTTEGYEVHNVSPDVEAFGVACGVNPNDFIDAADPAAPFALLLEAFELWGDVTLDQFLDSHVGGDLGTAPTAVADPNLGGEVATWCGTAGRVICVSLWHRNGLVLDLGLVGPADQLDDAQAQQLLLSMIPDTVNNLAEWSSGDETTTTTAAPLPPTTMVPASLPPPTTTIPAPPSTTG